MDSPIVVAAFKSPSEAEEAREALIRSGIEAGEGPRTDFDRIGPDIFADGFDVYVGRGDADRAVEILRQRWPEIIDVEPVERCPACGSDDIAALPRLRLLFALAIVLVAAILAFGQQDLFLLAGAVIAAVLLLAPNHRCRTCGERWTPRGGR